MKPIAQLHHIRKIERAEDAVTLWHADGTLGLAHELFAALELADGTREVAEIASELNVSPRWAQVMLEVLANLELLAWEDTPPQRAAA